VVIIAFFAMRYNEVHGHWPLLKRKQSEVDARSGSETSSEDNAVMTAEYVEKKTDGALEPPTTIVRELRE